MKLIVIPPYRGVNYTPTEGQFMVRQLVANMEKKGQLEGVEIDIDDGHPAEHTAETRDEEVFAKVTVGVLKRVRMYCEGDKYDAIVTSGGNDLGFFLSDQISGDADSLIDLLEIRVVADEDHNTSARYVFRDTPADDLVVIHLRNNVIKGHHLAILVELTFPPHSHNIEVVLRGVYDGQRIVKRGGYLFSPIVSSGHAGG